jgi:hypothetical protein
MSLFSKLFSRDEKVPGEPQAENAPGTASDAKSGAAKPEAAAVGGTTAQDPPAQAAVAEKKEQAPVSTPHEKAGNGSQPESSNAKSRGAKHSKEPRAPGPAQPAAKGPPLKPGAANTSKKDQRSHHNKSAQGRGPAANQAPQVAQAVVPPVPAGGQKANPPAPAAAAPKPAAAAPAPAAQNASPQAPAVAKPEERKDARAAAPTTVKATPEVKPVVEAPVARPPEAAPAARALEVSSVRPMAVVVVGQQPAGAASQPRPAAPTAQVSPANPIAQASQASLDDAIDAAMDGLVAAKDPHAPAVSANSNASDERALAETFAAVAQVHAQPLREFMFQLELGRMPREWSLASRPILKPLMDAAQQIGLLELVGALGAFDAALERAAAESSPFIGERAAQSLTAAYQGLCRQLPDAFTPAAGSDGRRLVFLESLLLQIPDLHRRTLTKLYAAGLTSLAQLSQARPDELSAVAGIEEPLAKRMVEHVQRFEADRARVNPNDMKGQALERLRALLDRLLQLQADFEQAENEESVDKKRAARRGREAALLELDLVFAEIGEVQVIEDLKRVPVQIKIRRVATYLDQLQASA